MGIALGLYTAARFARYVVPTFAEGAVGRLSREDVDQRCRDFADEVVHSARIHLEIRGRERVPRGRAFVYMSNHQSHVDIPVLYATVPSKTLRMVAKSELFKVPLWGPAMRAAGFIEVDRSDPAKAIASVNRAAEQIADGVSIWIAPEGTRSETGAIGELKKGGFHLARNTETPIVPVAIDGTRHILPKGARSMTPGQPVRVTFGAPIETAGREIAELVDQVRAFLDANVSTDL